MATPRKQTATATGKPLVALADLMDDGSSPDPEYDPGNLPDAMDISVEMSLNASLQQLGEDETDGARIIFHRVIEEKGKDVEVWLCEIPAVEFATEGIGMIERLYGGGRYKARVFVKGGRGFVTSKFFRVDGDARRPVNPAPVAGPMAGYPVPVMPDIAAILAAQQVSMMEGFRQLASTLAPVQAPLGIREMIELIAVMNGNKAPAVDPIAQALQLVALRDKLAPLPTNAEGEVDGGTLLLRGMETFGPLVKSIMDQSAQNRAAVPASAPAQPLTLAAPVAPAGGAVAPLAHNPTGEAPVNIAMMAVKAPLLVAAASNSDPWSFAGMVVQFFDPAQIQQYIHAPDWFTQVCTEIPEAKDHQEWFTQLRADVLEQLEVDAANDAPKTGELTSITKTDRVSSDHKPGT